MRDEQLRWPSNRPPYTPMRMQIETLREFENAVAGASSEVDLFGAAMLIARIGGDQPNPHGYARKLDLLGDAVLEHNPGRDTASLVNAIDHLLFEVEGFRGNQLAYSDPANSFLHEVIDRKTGIPITLSLVYMEVAQRVGLRCEGIGYPGHFIVRCGGPEAPIFVDPFHQGVRLDHEELLAGLRGMDGLSGQPETYLAAVTSRQILQRMLMNLYNCYRASSDQIHLLAVVEMLLCIEPWNSALVGERGLLHYRLGHDKPALADLEAYVAFRGIQPCPPAAHAALAELRTKLAHNQESQ